MRYNLAVAYLLWLFSGCGILGFHRFYLGKVPTGLLWLCTGGLAGIGAIYDFFTLSRQVWERNALMGARYEAVSAATPRNIPVNAAPPESLEHVILRTARKNGGAVTAGEIALEADVGIETARKELDRLAAASHAELRVRSSGVVVYVFGEFAGPETAGGKKDDYIA